MLISLTNIVSGNTLEDIELETNKQDNLTAGENIVINDNVISQIWMII